MKSLMKSLSMDFSDRHGQLRPAATFGRSPGLATAVLLTGVILLAVQTGAIFHAIEHSSREHHTSCHICIVAKHSGDCLTVSVPVPVATTSYCDVVLPLESVFVESARHYTPVRGPPVLPSL